jgi:hypothetical protein
MSGLIICFATILNGFEGFNYQPRKINKLRRRCGLRFAAGQEQNHATQLQGDPWRFSRVRQSQISDPVKFLTDS